MNICLYGASSPDIDSYYCDRVFELGREIALRGHTLVFGAGASGLMGAAARGVTSANGKLIGIVPSFFNVDGILYDKCTEIIYTEDMRSRKKLMEEKADAFITVPGGIGTYEEFFEILTLKQLGRHRKPMALFNIENYYDGIISALENTAEKGFMKKECLRLFGAFDNAYEMLNALEKGDDEDLGDIRFKNI